MSVLKWLGKLAQSAVDPDREYRVNHLETHLVKALKAGGQRFTIANVQLPPDFAKADLEEAAQNLFLKHLEQAWADQVITAAEQKRLVFLVKALQIPIEKAKALRLTCVKKAFEIVLARAIDDGVIDPEEKRHLSHITAQAGIPLDEFVNTYFKSECEDFLRGVFLNAVSDGELTQLDWDNLVATIETLGISQVDFLAKISGQATTFVEHVLADAKADDRISQNEQAQLLWLLDCLRLPKEFRRYVLDEIREITSREQIEAGILPSLEVPTWLETVGGELVHAIKPCSVHHTRKLKSGPKVTVHDGALVVTDRRIVFVSDSKSFRLSYRSVLMHAGNDLEIKLRAQNKPLLHLVLRESDRSVYPIFCSALAIANQTKTANPGEQKSRYISRDTRQTVWRRYGGRCADCNANDYLEFDHIIPVAKGGSNSEANIQLLCRRCNNKKSDKI